MCQSLDFKILFLGNKFERNDTAIGIDGEGTIERIFMSGKSYPNRKGTG